MPDVYDGVYGLQEGGPAAPVIPTDLLRWGQGLHARTLELVAGVSVTYRRGSTAIALVAVPAPCRAAEQGLADGSTLAGQWQDWIVLAEHVATIDPPSRGDVIEETSAPDQQWEVMPVARQPAYRPMGPALTQYRIHTRRIL